MRAHVGRLLLRAGRFLVHHGQRLAPAHAVTLQPRVVVRVDGRKIAKSVRQQPPPSFGL